MNKAFAVILATVLLDAVGMGLVMPIVPQLLREVGHTTEIAWSFGLFTAIYAALQFVCAPVLGALSDRFGRRPVLLVSLFGAAVDYVFMALAPTFALLVIGRAIAGISGASMVVASAYIADITPEEQRTRRFGYLSAGMGVGFIVGPLLGGVLGDVWTRAPFLLAAALNGLNFLVAVFVLPESHTGERGKLQLSAFNPFEPLRWAFTFKPLLPLLGVFIVLSLVGQIGGNVWVLYGEDKFKWTGMAIGLSIAAYGLCMALCQALVAGPVSQKFGTRNTIVLGAVLDALAYSLIAFATRGWMGFALIPLFGLGGIGLPALQAMLSGLVDENHQGRLNGVLVSIGSLASIGAPLAISHIYFASRADFPGLIWVLGAALYVLCIPALYGGAKRAEPA